MKNERNIWLWIACLCLAATGTIHAADKDRGKKIYDVKCAMCHGKDAKGNASMQKAMKLPAGALNLTDKDSAEFIRVTENGKDKMPAFKGKLKASDIEDMDAYVASLASREKSPDDKASAPEKPAESTAAVKKIYNAKCALCHGKDGKGNPGLAKALKIEPASLDLTGKATFDKTDEDLSSATGKGRGKMPAYADKLSDEEIEALTRHIRSLSPRQESGKPKEDAAAR